MMTTNTPRMGTKALGLVSALFVFSTAAHAGIGDKEPRFHKSPPRQEQQRQVEAAPEVKTPLPPLPRQEIRRASPPPVQAPPPAVQEPPRSSPPKTIPQLPQRNRRDAPPPRATPQPPPSTSPREAPAQQRDEKAQAYWNRNRNHFNSNIQESGDRGHDGGRHNDHDRDNDHGHGHGGRDHDDGRWTHNDRDRWDHGHDHRDHWAYDRDHNRYYRRPIYVSPPHYYGSTYYYGPSSATYIGLGLPSGFIQVTLGAEHYYTHRGIFYRRGTSGFYVVSPPRGIIVPRLPAGCARVYYRGLPYYRYGTVYYRPVTTGYMIVESTTLSSSATVEPPRVTKADAAYGHSFWINDFEYLLIDGQFYRESPSTMVWIEPPYGALTLVLPEDAETIWYEDVQYFVTGGHFLRKTIDGYVLTYAPWDARQ